MTALRNAHGRTVADRIPVNAGKVIRWACGAALLCFSCSLPAQTVRLVNPTTMQFTDAVYGVSFSFPASWTFSEGASFFVPPSIFAAPMGDGEGKQPRASVSVKRVAGIRPYPATRLMGIEFSYAVRDQTTPEDCKYLAAMANAAGHLVDQVTQDGVTFYHGSGEGAGLGHGESEDIYTVPHGTECLLFDLAMQYENNGVDDQNPRNLTRGEKTLAHRQLQAVFSSLEIGGTSVPSGFPVIESTEVFADSHGVSFEYPSIWTLSKKPQFYGPEAILTPPDDQHSDASAIAVAASNDRVFGDLRATDFDGASFVFNVEPAASEADCLGNLRKVRDFEMDRLETRLVDGVPFRFVATGAAGGCHQVSESIYVHQSGGSCLLFDLAVHAVCADDDRREMKPEEVREVRLELETILSTVRLSGPARNGAEDARGSP